MVNKPTKRTENKPTKQKRTYSKYAHILYYDTNPPVKCPDGFKEDECKLPYFKYFSKHNCSIYYNRNPPPRYTVFKNNKDKLSRIIQELEDKYESKQ